MSDDTPDSLKGFDTHEDGYARHLGTLGDTDVYIVAEGPKAQWCADVLASKVESVFESIRAQVDGWGADDE